MKFLQATLVGNTLTMVNEGVPYAYRKALAMSQNSDEQQIREVVDKWMRAIAAEELEQVLPLMAEDVVFLQAGQPPMRGREAFAAALRPVLQQSKASLFNSDDRNAL